MENLPCRARSRRSSSSNPASASPASAKVLRRPLCKIVPPIVARDLETGRENSQESQNGLVRTEYFLGRLFITPSCCAEHGRSLEPIRDVHRNRSKPR